MEKSPSALRPRSSSAALSDEANRAAAQLEELGDFLSGDAFENLEISPPPPIASTSGTYTVVGGSHVGHKKGIHHVIEVA